ncbi:histidine kinase dimerization/phosphoacceptor domain -containing protein [Rhodocytophaga aerolata]|uniref:histidine kinase n=1 Tax=Rhodocytophaga aerolata TaxID=455078 RepID=A0ABT8RES2_9BACT|nr:histidine kinase dimerization/phosphoacceptor domain -containing protein [Rhodocytophaga aerolata]MDO1449693.1 histidine kinase dimerization/phosphoacceptor domain -containing protein [Rhodocytophaga aerolata]
MNTIFIRVFFSPTNRRKREYLILIFLLLLNALPISGQNITRKMATQLLGQLQESKADENRVKLLLELGKFHVYKAGEVRADLDSGQTYLQEASQLSDSLQLHKWKRDAESMLVIVYMERDDTLLGQTRFLQLIKNCRKAKDKETEALARFRYGTCLRVTTHNIPEVFSNYAQAADLYREINNVEQELVVRKEIASLHSNMGKLYLAESQLEEILLQYQAIKFPKLHYTYNLLANVSRLKGDYKKALSYTLQCIESMNKSQDTLSAASFYGNLARLYMDLGKHEQSIAWYKKSLQKWRQEKLPNFALYMAASFITLDLLEKQQPHEALQFIENLVKEIPTNTNIQRGCVAQTMAYCYEALQDFRLAEKYYLESVAWYATAGTDFEMSQKVHQDIGKFYLDRKEYKKAGEYLRKTLAYAPQKNSLLTIKDIHFMLYKVDSASGNYLSALDHFTIHKILNDSIFNSTKSKQIEELQIQYETAQKDQNIQLLTRQGELQQAKLQQARSDRNMTLGGITLLLVIIGLLYNQYRVKQRNNEQLQQQQNEINQKNLYLQQLVSEKEWLLKEVHHRVKNNLHTVTSLLESQSAYLEDNALAAIRDSQHRVFAMSLIHQKLYQSDNLTSINMAVYVQELVQYLQDSFDTRQQIRFQLHLEPMELDVSQAVPIGLILNEAITNAVKYAFPHGITGTIAISITRSADDWLMLSVADNGIGLPPDFSIKTVNSLGMKLMRGLSEDLGARFSIESSQGTKITMNFPIDRVLQHLRLSSSSVKMEYQL